MTRIALLLVSFVVAACVPCEDQEAALAEACLPSSAAAERELVIEVQEDCGSPCSPSFSCTALRDFDQINVLTNVLECPGEGCDDSCERRTTTCVLPALEPGSYTVTFPNLPSKTLFVQAGGSPSCAL